MHSPTCRPRHFMSVFLDLWPTCQHPTFPAKLCHSQRNYTCIGLSIGGPNGENLLAWLKQQWHPLQVDLAVPGMGWSPAEGSERGRCQCKSTPALMLISSLNHICFMIILNFVHLACPHDGGLHFSMISNCVLSSYVYLHKKNVSPMLFLWSRSTPTGLFIWWCRHSQPLRPSSQCLKYHVSIPCTSW